MSSGKPRQFYEVEKLLKMKVIHHVKYYLTKWKGYSQKQSTWQPEAHVAHLVDDINSLNAKEKQKDDLKEPKSKKIVKNKKKTNGQKIQEYLSSKTNEMNRVSSQSLNNIDLQKNSSTDMPLEQKYLQTIKNCKHKDSQVCILEKLVDLQTGTRFKIYKDKGVFELSEKQTKIMFPFQLSFYYEQIIRKVLFTKYR